MSFDPIYPLWLAQLYAHSNGIGNVSVIEARQFMGNDETEPTIELVPNSKEPVNQGEFFQTILEFLHEQPDILLVPQSYWDQKPPLFNGVMDTVRAITEQPSVPIPNITLGLAPSLAFYFNGLELRVRGEIQLPDSDVTSGGLHLIQRDWTVKTQRQKKSNTKTVHDDGRDEIDKAIKERIRIGKGFQRLKTEVAKANNGTDYLCDRIDYRLLGLIAAYITSRNTYAFAHHVEIDGKPAVLVLEACEDMCIPTDRFFDSTINQNRYPQWNTVTQFEFELKAVIGLNPDEYNRPEGAARLKAQIRDRLFTLESRILHHLDNNTAITSKPTEISKSRMAINFLQGVRTNKESYETYRQQCHSGVTAPNGIIEAAQGAKDVITALREKQRQLEFVARALQNLRSVHRKIRNDKLEEIDCIRELPALRNLSLTGQKEIRSIPSFVRTTAPQLAHIG